MNSHESIEMPAEKDETEEMIGNKDNKGMKQGIGTWFVPKKFKFQGSFQDDLFHGEKCIYENFGKTFKRNF